MHGLEGKKMAYKITQTEPYVGQEELSNLIRVIENKWLTEGPFSKEFLSVIKEFTGSKHALLTNNGTLALYLALKAVGIKADDEVIVPDFTFNASGSSVVFAGGKPVFIDVDENTFNIDVEKIEGLITSRTKAIMPVHVYGQSADMDPILKLAEKHQLKIIEDAAQGYGVFYKGSHTGTLGDVGTISFFADKTVTTGEGAVILTNSDAVYDNLRYLRNQGRLSSGSFIHEEMGMNFRVTDLQSAVGVAQLKKFRNIEKIKSNHFSTYKELLGGMPEIEFQKEVEYSNIVPFRASIKVKDPSHLMSYLDDHGIQIRGFFYPLHRQPCFNYLGYKENDFPVTNKLNASGLCLPVHCGLSKDDILYVCDMIKEFYAQK